MRFDLRDCNALMAGQKKTIKLSIEKRVMATNRLKSRSLEVHQRYVLESCPTAGFPNRENSSTHDSHEPEFRNCLMAWRRREKQAGGRQARQEEDGNDSTNSADLGLE